MKALYIMPEEYLGLLKSVIKYLGTAWLDLHDRQDLAAAAAKVQAAHRSVCGALEARCALLTDVGCDISVASAKRWIYDETMAASKWRDELESLLDDCTGEAADAWVAKNGERCLRALMASLERLLAHDLMSRYRTFDRATAN